MKCYLSDLGVDQVEKELKLGLEVGWKLGSVWWRSCFMSFEHAGKRKGFS